MPGWESEGESAAMGTRAEHESTTAVQLILL